MDQKTKLLRRIRWLTWFFIVALIFSGVTAIPLETELNLLLKISGSGKAATTNSSGFIVWLVKVRDALHETNLQHPFIGYGFDWLAFGHIVIAIVFIGAVRDPVRNIWLYDFGMIACALVVPWAFIFGGVRGIPFGWRLIDCSFGVIGFIPLWLCKKWTKELEGMN
jgi:hypothetical protein